MRYTPGQFSAPTSPTTPSIGGGTYTPVSTSGSQITVGGGAAFIPGSIGKAPRAGSAAPMTPQTLTPGTPSLFKGGASPIKQVNPYGGNTTHGYYHGSNRWSGRQTSDRQNPITRVNGEVIPLPPHATAGSMPRRPVIPAMGYGGTSQNNANPGVGSMSAGATSSAAGSGSGKIMSSSTGLRGI